MNNCQFIINGMSDVYINSLQFSMMPPPGNLTVEACPCETCFPFLSFTIHLQCDAGCPQQITCRLCGEAIKLPRGCICETPCEALLFPISCHVMRRRLSETGLSDIRKDVPPCSRYTVIF